MNCSRYFILILLLLCACGRSVGPFEHVSESDTASICRIELDTGDLYDLMQSKSILPEDEIDGKVTQVTLASYGVSGRRIDCRHYEGDLSRMELLVDAANDTDVYILANMGDITSAFPDLKSGLAELEFIVGSYDDVAGTGMPMCASGKVAGGKSSAAFMLERLFAKLYVRILHDGIRGNADSQPYAYNLRNVSLYLRQANARLLPFAEEGSCACTPEDLMAEADFNPDLNDRNAYEGHLSPSQLGPGPGYFRDTTLVLYVPENMQGVLLPENTDPLNKVPSSTDVSHLCTFVELNAFREQGYGYTGSVTYRCFLGEDPVTDFNIRRNRIYSLTLNLTESGLFIDSWKVDRGDDWKDTRVLKFMEEPYMVYAGDTTSVVVHYHRFASGGSNSYPGSDEWQIQYDMESLTEAGLTMDPAGFQLKTGVNGYMDYRLLVSADEDASDGAEIPLEIHSWDGTLSSFSTISVRRGDNLSLAWEQIPEYVSQYGILNVSGVPSDRLPVSLASTDESVLRFTRVDDDTFRIVALKEGSVDITVSNSSGSQTKTVTMDVKAPLLRIRNHPEEINPDGTTSPVSCEFLTDEGKPLSGYDEGVYNSVLRMSLSDRNIVLMGAQGDYRIAITNFGDLVPGTVRELQYSVPGCPGAGTVTCGILITDPFKDVVSEHFGAVNDYSLIRMLGLSSAVYEAFADEIAQSSGFVFPVAPVNADISCVSAAMKPRWESVCSGANEVYAVSYKRDASLSAAGAAVTADMQNIGSATSHGVGPHDIVLYVRNSYSGQKLEHVCGSVDVYVHNVLGATAYMSSQQGSYAPTGGKTFAQVYNELVGRTLYYQYSTGYIHYMDVYVDFMAPVKGVLIWNKMQENASQRYNGYDALSFLQPAVSDGSTDSNLRHLYSVNSGAGERSVICGEDSGVRKGLGNMLYRALRLEAVSSTPSETVLHEWFLGYDRTSGALRTQFAPAYRVYDVSAGESVPHTLPYYFTPSSLSEYVDSEGRGYHVVHFLEDVVPSSNGWTNLLD